jgi:N-acyl-D-amino-acid deacylase
MVALVEQGMRDGAFGLSTGLFYVPGSFTPLDEVVELARAAGRMGGIHKSHQRDEASKVLDSFAETIAIGERGGLPTQATHAKVVGKANWGRSVDALRLWTRRAPAAWTSRWTSIPTPRPAPASRRRCCPRGRSRGAATPSGSGSPIPPRARRSRPTLSVMIRDERGGGDPKNVQFANCGFDPSLAGRTLADATAQRGLEPTIENAAETTLWIVEQGGCQGIFHAMHDEDLERILRHPAR